jgi:hypothetical protein
LEAQEYSKLVEALRCKRDDCEGCDLAFFDKDEGWMCQYAAKDDDAADAIEALLHERAEAWESAITWMHEVERLKQMPKQGEIVRCRECKWYSIYEAKKDGTPDKRYSPSVCLREIYAKRRDPDWFCADGEREVQDG